MGKVYRLEEFRWPGQAAKRGSLTRPTYFTRGELDGLLSLYSRRVATGEWRDYALDHRSGLAIFSVFRHSFERPIFSVAKRVSANGRSGEYLLFSGRERLARGATLGEVLAVFERRPQIVG